MKHLLYYEAILQLRNPSRKLIDFVEEVVEGSAVSVAKREEVKNGYDYYLSDQRFTKGLALKLQRKFGGQIKLSAKLWGMKKGKRLYRLTVLFRMPGFKVGDILEYKGKKLKVRSIGKAVLARGEGGKRMVISFKELERKGLL